jgi:hypothetical protein
MPTPIASSMLADLRSHERQVHSQGGEDGVLLCLFECLGATNRFFVEFGAWDGRHLSNTAHLRLDHGWTGLLMDGDPERVADGVEREFLTAENINDVFRKYDVPEAFDLLSIDIDGNEYWVWKALREYRPRVVAIEYNVFFGIDVSKTMPYDASHRWDKTMFHGASLAALRKLGREKGYTLLHTDSYAPNAFFVDDALLPQELIDLPIERVAAWDWDAGAEPPIAAGRAWMAV